jgi:hypothetical protein
MANAYIRSRSPKGNVGVTDVVDAGELSAYSAGVLSGFNATSAASLTLQIGGATGTQDVAIGKNPGGESELFSGTAGQSIAFIIGSAPATPGYSRTDALVIYKDPFTTSVVNNGVDVTDYQVVAGTAATTGTQVPPNEAAIRAAIPTGSLKFYCVIGYVTIAYAAASITTANYFKNPALLSKQVVSNATELGLITPIEGMRVYQADTDMQQVYDGSNWLNAPRLLKRVALTVAASSISVTGIPLRDNLQIKATIIQNGGTIYPGIRFNNISTTTYADQSNYSNGATAANVSQTRIPAGASPSASGNPQHILVDLLNLSTQMKVCFVRSQDIFAVDATTSLNYADTNGKWASTAQVNRVDFYNVSGTGNFAIGSYVEIYG